MSMKPTQEDCDIVGGKVSVLLHKGSNDEAIRVVREFVAMSKVKMCPFDGYERHQDLPLAMTDLNRQVISSLSNQNIITVGDVLKSTDVAIRSAHHVGPQKVAIVRAAAERLISAYYRAKTKT